MTVKEAEQIVREYSAYFAKHNEMKDWEKGPQVFSSSEMPWPSAKVKYAFFVYSEYLAKANQVDEALLHQLRTVYSSIDGTFKEEADEINQALLRYDQRVKQIINEDSVNSSKLIELEEIKFRAKYDGINPDLPDRNHAGEVELHNFIVDIQNSDQDK